MKVTLNKLLLIGLVIILAACANSKTLLFVGEGDSWLVHYEAVIKSANSEETIYRYEYIGDEKAPFEVDYLIGGQKGNTVLDEHGIFNTGISTCTGCAVTDEKQQLKTTIWWNGQMETIELNIK